MASVVVIGSANLDRSVRVETHPRPGETILGSMATMGAGGKGLNQAIAAARAGAATRFVGAVSADEAERTIRDALSGSGVSPLLAWSDEPSGEAFVMVGKDGENAIVVVPGANADSRALGREVDAVGVTLSPTDVVLTQLEIPIEVVTGAHTIARQRGATTILNAAPSSSLPDALLAATDILVVNEHECADLTEHRYADTVGAARELARRVETVIVTQGGRGALLASHDGVAHVDAHRVDVVDTTAAGDTFCGALAARIAEGRRITDAVRYAMAAAALAVQRPGAAGSIPSRRETQEFLAGIDARSSVSGRRRA